jgi:hypothetical protein
MHSGLSVTYASQHKEHHVLQPGGHPAMPTLPCHWTMSRNFWICFTSWCLISFPLYLYPETVFQSGVRTEILRDLMMWIPYETSWIQDHTIFFRPLLGRAHTHTRLYDAISNQPTNRPIFAVHTQIFLCGRNLKFNSSCRWQCNS